MSRIDLIYLILLLTCIPLGHVLKSLRSASLKQFLTFAVGLSVALLTAGFEGIWHSLFTIVGNYYIVKLVGLRNCRLASFLFVFGYLLFFRTCHYIGLPIPPAHCNAIQLMVTIRVIGLTFEYRQSHLNTGKDDDDDENYNPKTSEVRLWKSPINPSLYDHFCFAYCYCGLMTGPYYTYKTYTDMLKQDGSKIATVWPALRKLKYAPVLSVPYLILKHYFPESHIATDEYLNHPWGLVHRLAYLCPCFTWFRYRFYIGWLLAEAMCITLGVGAYPFESEPKPGIGPTKKYDASEEKAMTPRENGDTHSFGAVQNIDIIIVEMSSDVRYAMKGWNKTVQWWLANYVHRQLPFKKHRFAAVMFISAFWHGVYPGYYVTFMTVPLMNLSHALLGNFFKARLCAKQLYYYDWVTWFCLYRTYEYLSVGFIMLKLDIVWTVFKQNYFIGHFILALICIILLLMPRPKATANGDVDMKKGKADSKAQ